jgi:hypothetical protein
VRDFVVLVAGLINGILAGVMITLALTWGCR